MSMDRQRLLFKYLGTRVHKNHWYRKGSPVVAARANHPIGVNMYAGMTKLG